MGSRIGTKAKIRSAIIGAVDALAAFPVGAALLRRRFGTAHIRAINYHAFSRDLASGFERQLAFYAKHFDDCSRSDLDVLLSGSPETSSWSRPRLLISFDDGFSGQYEIAAPLLEKYGFTGWFFVPSWHIGRELDAPTSESGGIAGSFMSAAQLQELVARGHVVGCHTRHHTRLVATLSQEQLETEIVAARDDIEASIGGKIDVFCWVRGDEPSYSAPAQRKIEAAKYRYSFMTNLLPITAGTDPLYLERTNIEADWPLSHVRFYLSGIMDLAYAAKRRRVAAKLAVPTA